MKKVITGHDGQGKSVFFKVESEAVTVGSPILDWHEIWATHADDKIPVDTSAGKSREQYTADVHNVFPGTNQSMFRVLDFKPGDMADALSPDELDAFISQLPGVASHMEQDDPGMHTTDSVDYGVIISGKIKLELDDGEQVELTAGDVFVQNGTRHAWRVEEHCRMAVVLVGTDIPYTPEYTLATGAEYSLNFGSDSQLVLRGTYRYTGDYATAFEDNAPVLGGFGVLDLAAAYSTNNWRATLRLSNATDENEIVSLAEFDSTALSGGGILPPGLSYNQTYTNRPRTVSLNVSYTF